MIGLVNNKLHEYGRNGSRPKLRYYAEIFLEVPGTTTRSLSQDCCCLTRFESGTLPLTTKNSIHSMPKLSVTYVKKVTVNAKAQRTYYLWYSITDV